MRSESLRVTYFLVAGVSAACGARTNDAGPGGGAQDHGAPDSQASQADGHCSSGRRPPTFSFEPACTRYVPGLAAFEMQLVGRELVIEAGGALPLVEHRFRVDADSFQCGFEVVVRLHGLNFGTVGDRFDGFVWWLQGAGPLSLTSLVLRSADRLRLLVGAQGSTHFAGVHPHELVFEPGVCGPDSVRAVLAGDGASFECRPDAIDPTLELCTIDDMVLRAVPFFGPPPTEPAVILGDAEMLAPAS